MCKVFQCTFFILNYYHCYWPFTYTKRWKSNCSILPHKGRGWGKHYGLQPQFLCSSTAFCCLKSRPTFFIISKIMIVKPNPSAFSETKFSMKLVDVQLHCREVWCVFFEQLVSLEKIILLPLLLLAQWRKGTLSPSALFSKKKVGTLYFVVGVSVNIKLPHGMSPAIANCRVKLAMQRDELLS